MSWDQLIWKAYEIAKEIQVPQEDICKDSEKILIAVPAQVNNDQAKLVCQNFGNGRIHVPNTKEDFLSFRFWYLETFGPTAETYCNKLWTPFTDQLVEGNFINCYDGSTPEYLPFL